MADIQFSSFMNVSRFVAILIFLSEISYGISFTNENGAVTPRDPFKFLGETLILYCNITNDDLPGDSKDLYFVRKKGEEEKEIDRRNVEILTTKSVRLRLPNVRLEDDGTYTCKLRTYNKPKYIGHQVVKVDYKPSPIYNVSCRVMNWESMTCNWTLGVVYQHLDDINVNLVWTVDGKQEMCPQMAANKSSCTWTFKEYLHNHKYFMKLIVENLKRKEPMARAYSPQFNVETRLYENSSHVNETGIVIIAKLEPAPVNNLMATVENSRCIALAWQHSSRPEREKVFIIQYKSLATTHWENFSFNPEERKKMNTTVCGLHPDTDYTFRIKVMPYPEYPSDPNQRNGFSSPWKIVPAKTEEDVPEAAPLICPSCFFEHPCNLENDTVCPVVTIYWKDIPSDKRNGRITGYRITLANETSSLSVTDISVHHKMKYFANVPLSSNDMEYTLTMKGRTRKGYSRHSSQILIPSKSFRPKAPSDFLVQKGKNEGEDEYYLVWEEDKAPGLTQKKIIIVWCFGTIPDFICKGDIHWIPLSADKVNHKFIPDATVEAQGNLIFGIAREVYYHNKTYSSGIQWASCIYHKNGKSPAPPHILHVTNVPEIRGLTVGWEKNDCPKDLVHVTRYGVSLCKTANGKTCTDESAKLQDVVNNSVYSYTFRNLTPRTKYMVYVWAESNSGDGPKSIPKTGIVEENRAEEKIKEGAIIAICVLGVLLLLIVLICIFYGHQKIQARRRKLPSWNADIQPKSEYLVPNMHVQSRPLPEVPREDPHYGANACMKNPGSDSEKEKKSKWMSCNGINATKSNPFKPQLCYRTESIFGDETTSQPLIQHQNDYETNFGMFPAPNPDKERCDTVDTIDAYETPVSGTDAISCGETFRQATPQEGTSDYHTSLIGGSSGVSSYVPINVSPHLSTTDMPIPEACICPSESPPLNVAPPPPPRSDGNSLSYDEINQEQSESPSLVSHLHAFPSDSRISLDGEMGPSRFPRTSNYDPDHNTVIKPPSYIVHFPSSEITHLAPNPRSNSLHNDSSRRLPLELSRSSDGHSDTSDSSNSNEYSRMALSEPHEQYVHPGFNAIAPNSTPLDCYIPNGFTHSSDVLCDIILQPNGYSKVVPHDMSSFSGKSNNNHRFMPCDTFDHSETSADCSTFVPCDTSPVIQTPNEFSRIPIPLNGCPNSKAGASLPKGYCKSVSHNRNSVTVNDLKLPPPPPYPPPSSETIL